MGNVQHELCHIMVTITTAIPHTINPKVMHITDTAILVINFSKSLETEHSKFAI